jgi:hypothetical protein
MTGESKAPSLGEVVGAAAFLVSLITAWLYAAGWSYAYAYFDQFRIPLILADLPREHLFVYGGLTLWKNPLAAGATAAVISAIAVLCIRFRAEMGRSWLAAVVVGTVIALFCAAHFAGVRTALADAGAQRTNDFSAYPRVLIEFPEDAETSDGRTTASGGCGRLVLATGERMFLVAPRRDMPALELNTVVVPWDGVASVTISGQYSSCP